MFTVFPTKIFYSADREESTVLYYRGNNNSIIGFWVSYIYIYICTTREYRFNFRANGGGPFACFGFRKFSQVHFYRRFATVVFVYVCTFRHESLLRFFIFQFRFLCFVPTNNNNRYDYMYIKKKKLLTSTVFIII